MDDRERFAANAQFCRKQAALLKDPDAIAQWERLAREYERLAANPAAAQASMIVLEDGGAEERALNHHQLDDQHRSALPETERATTARGSSRGHCARSK
jgi:hypothetical protein